MQPDSLKECWAIHDHRRYVLSRPRILRSLRQFEALQPEGIAPLFGVRPDQVGFYPVRNLHVLKLSYPRKDPQGGMIERDLHGGQQFARIVDLELL